MRIKLIFTIIIAILCVFLIVFTNANNSNKTSRSVVLVIPDGMGVPIVSAFDYYKSEYKNQGYSSFSEFDGSFLVRTRSLDYVVTDSAAAATAFATGQRVPNYQVGILKDNKRVPTIMDISKNKGKSTGIVVQCSLTHATPAAFYSYSISRQDDNLIAQQLLYSNIDLAIGGGKKYFLPFLEKFKQNQYHIILSEDELYSSIKQKKDYQKLIAFTAEKHPPKYSKRKVNLKDSSEYAISLLSKNPKGFFLMIEASQIDWYGHENNINDQLDEMQDLDNLLSWLVNYQKSNPNTLVFVVADHDCGGLSLIDYKASQFGPNFKVNYASDYHTADHIVGFYKGFIKVKPIIDNIEVFNILYDYIKNE